MKLKSQLDRVPRFLDDSSKIFSHIIGKHYPMQLIPYETRYYWHKHNPTKIKHFQQIYSAQPSDIFIVSYPKAGNHWLKKVAVEILANSDKNSNDCLFYKDGDVGGQSIPFWELFVSQVDENTFHKRILDTAHLSNRLWASHCPFPDFPTNDFKGKIILICRNPKDVVVSGYTFFRSYAHGEGADYCIDEYLSYFYRGILMFGDYFEWYKNWWIYYKDMKDTDNMLWLYYEDMVQDRLEYIKKISLFLNENKNIKMDDNDYEIVLNNSEINNMKHEFKTNPQTLEFDNIIRKGQNDDWQNILDETNSFLIDETMFFKWAKDANDIKYYQELVQRHEYFKNASIQM